ncbi:hypothetical protein PLESTM_000893300 [Pleodorina starrii]|nr:hypothetical protein PLESTM_000893300 [Pleodorina starrii]
MHSTSLPPLSPLPPPPSAFSSFRRAPTFRRALRVARHSSLATRQSSLVTRHSSSGALADGAAAPADAVAVPTANAPIGERPSSRFHFLLLVMVLFWGGFLGEIRGATHKHTRTHPGAWPPPSAAVASHSFGPVRSSPLSTANRQPPLLVATVRRAAPPPLAAVLSGGCPEW